KVGVSRQTVSQSQLFRAATRTPELSTDFSKSDLELQEPRSESAVLSSCFGRDTEAWSPGHFGDRGFPRSGPRGSPHPPLPAPSIATGRVVDICCRWRS